MLSINDLKIKSIVMIDGIPYQVLEVKHLHMGRGGSSVQTKIKNLITGQTFSRNYKPSDSFEEAGIEKRELVYLYAHRGSYVFARKENNAERYTLSQEKLGDAAQWFKPNTSATALIMSEEIISVTPPIKVELRVSEAPPGVIGNTATGGTKQVTLETGAEVSTPLFVEEGDIVRVNTETGEYVERVSKGNAK